MPKNRTNNKKTLNALIKCVLFGIKLNFHNESFHQQINASIESDSESFFIFSGIPRLHIPNANF